MRTSCRGLKFSVVSCCLAVQDNKSAIGRNRKLDGVKKATDSTRLTVISVIKEGINIYDHYTFAVHDHDKRSLFQLAVRP